METITLNYTLTKKEAFYKLARIIPSASEAKDPNSDWNKLIDFLWVEYIRSELPDSY